MSSHPNTSIKSQVTAGSAVEIHLLKRRYEYYLSKGKGLDPKTIEHRMSAIDRLAKFLGAASIKSFSSTIAMKYVEYALKFKNARTDKLRALTTIAAELNRLKDFLTWLQSQPGYKSRIRLEDVTFLSLNRKDLRAARGGIRKSQPSIFDCRLTFQKMPYETEVELRNRALFALLMLTGGRIDALISLQIQHLNIERRYIVQSGAESRTKNSKTFLSGFFRIDKIYLKELKGWVRFLKKKKGFRDCDPLFPKPKLPEKFAAGSWGNISCEFYKGPGQPSRMVSEAFMKAIGERHGPHSLRRTITNWVVKSTQRQDELKAAARNLGHSELRTTINSYLHLTEEQQLDLVSSIGKKSKKGKKH